MRTIDVELPTNFQWSGPPDIWVSTGETQDAGATSTTASGQLDYVTYPTPSGFRLQNNACAEYYVYFSVTGTLTTADAGAQAGGEAGGDAAR
jgi:hypothetical protein